MPFLTEEELRAALTELNAAQAMADAFAAAYAGGSDQYKLGASALLRDLTGAEATPDNRLVVTAGLPVIQGLYCVPVWFADYRRYFFETLSGQFTANQRIQVCMDMLEISDLVPKESLRLVFRNMIVYGTQQLDRDEGAAPKCAAVMSKRLNNLCCFLSGLAKSGTASAVFGGRSCELLPTGSDAHLGNRQAVILRARLNPALMRVFKPRSVLPDRAVQRCLEELNKGLPPEVQLPILGITPDTGDVCGSETLVRKVGEMSATAAARYFRQMGALLCIAKLVGLTDVHQDNVMPTEDGPVVIDAECALDPWVMRGGNLFSTLANMALTMDGTEMGPNTALALFDITGKGPSCGVFKDYAKEIREGYALAVRCCRTRREALFALIARETRSVRTIRYVPLETGGFYNMAEKYYSGESLKTQNNYLALAGKVAQTGLPAHSGGYPGWSKTLERCVAASLDNGDVPYFTLSMPGSGSAAGEIRCDGSIVGNVAYLFRTPIEAVLDETLNFLESTCAQSQLNHLLGAD